MPLARLAVGHPSVAGRQLADEVVSAAHRVRNRVSWIINDLAQGRTPGTAITETTAEWDHLSESIDRLREALHESP